MRKRHRPARASAPPAGAPLLEGRVEEAGLALLAGYRVVRRLGSSARADVYLGHAGHRETEARASEARMTGARVREARPEGTGRPASVALKVFGPEADTASIEREIRALSQAPAGRLPELLDVATLPDGRVCLVLERLAGASLGRHLGSVDRLEPGEAVTILAPVVMALSALHEAGFAHEGLSQSSVLFDAWGRPVVTGLGALRDLPPAGVARIPALRANYLRLGVLVRGVFDCLDRQDPATPAADQLVRWFEDRTADVPFRPCLDDLERRLFGWAEATAVRLPGTGSPGGADAGAAALAGAPTSRGLRAGRPMVRMDPGAVPTGDAALDPHEGTRLPAWFALFHLPPELRATVAGALDANPVAAGMARLRDRARLRRRPVLLAALLASALVLPVLGLLPESAGSERPGAEQSGTGRPSTEQSGAQPAAAGHGTDSPADEAPNSESNGARDAAALAGNDPVLAVPALLRLRAGCLSAASVVCLDGVDQPGSAIIAADSYDVRSAQQGGSAAAAPTFDGHTASLVERTGNSALVALVPPDGPAGPEIRPASVLAVKGEVGWRLREIFDF